MNESKLLKNSNRSEEIIERLSGTKAKTVKRRVRIPQDIKQWNDKCDSIRKSQAQATSRMSGIKYL